jgi:hypothetical protein
MKTKNVYWRKTKRHHWNCIAQCHDNQGEFIRQIYMAQVDAPEWQVGWTTEDHMGLYPDNKKANYPMTIAPNITDNDTARALESFAKNGFASINPLIMGKIVDLGLLDKEITQ